MIRPERKRNAPFDAMAYCDGIEHGENPSKPEAGRIGKALSVIRLITPDATPEQIGAAAEQYRRHWPEIDLTSTALAAHWRKFHTMAERARASEVRRAEISSEMLLASGESFQRLQRQLQDLEDGCR